MSTFRTGNHWGVTIVREGDAADAQWVCFACGYHNVGGVCTHCGNIHLARPDELVAVVVNGDQELAERIARLLTAEEREQRRKPTDCPRCGDDAPKGEFGVCQPCAVAEGWTSNTALEVGPGVPSLADVALDPHRALTDLEWVADSCTGCTASKGDPDCPVHQGRKPRGPKPPPLGAGCICDGSGRACPRHGEVM